MKKTVLLKYLKKLSYIYFWKYFWYRSSK